MLLLSTPTEGPTEQAEAAELEREEHVEDQRRADTAKGLLPNFRRAGFGLSHSTSALPLMRRFHFHPPKA